MIIDSKGGERRRRKKRRDEEKRGRSRDWVLVQQAGPISVEEHGRARPSGGPQAVNFFVGRRRTLFFFFCFLYEPPPLLFQMPCTVEYYFVRFFFPPSSFLGLSVEDLKKIFMIRSRQHLFFFLRSTMALLTKPVDDTSWKRVRLEDAWLSGWPYRECIHNTIPIRVKRGGCSIL